MSEGDGGVEDVLVIMELLSGGSLPWSAARAQNRFNSRWLGENQLKGFLYDQALAGEL